MSAPTLTTDKFVIRAFAEKDLDAFSQYRAHSEVAKYQSWTHYSYDDALSLFNGIDYSTFGTEGQWYQLAIADRQSDNLVGDIAVHFIDQQQVEIGFTVDPQYQGQQVATEAVRCFLNYVFSELNSHRVVATTDAKNIASYKLLEKLGFRREGHYIQNIFFKGAWGDEYFYALLKSEL